MRTSSEGCGLLGSGSFRTVHFAIDCITQTLVAIKSQSIPDDTAERELMTHFAMLRYPHRNLVSMVDWFTRPREDDGSVVQLCIVMPLCDSNLEKVYKFKREFNKCISWEQLDV